MIGPTRIRVMHPAIGEFAFSVRDANGVVIGRNNLEVDLQFNWDPRISRKHCRFSLEDGRLFFLDLGSQNGSWHGTSPLKGRTVLEPGMSVLVGETVLFVAGSSELDGESTAPGPAPVPTDAPPCPPPQVGAYSAALGPTTDLRFQFPSSPVPPRHRLVPRFISRHAIEVEFETRQQLRELWTQDISSGGLFVEAEDPPSPGEQVTILFKGQSGKLILRGQVIHTLSKSRAKKLGGSPGAGIQFVDLTPDQQAAMEAFLANVEEHESAVRRGGDRASSAGARALELAARVLGALETGDLYAALGVPPAADDATVQGSLVEVRGGLAEECAGLTPEQRERIAAARTLFDRVALVLGQPSARLEYDFRNGQLRAQERIQAARGKTGPSLEMLRQAYNKAAPDMVDRAAFLTRRAFAARQAKNLEEAIAQAETALEHNPFFVELEATLAAWRELLAKGGS